MDRSPQTQPPVLRIYRGLPASGKTTSARRWVAEDPQGRARVNRDDLRAMLHGGYVDGMTERRAVAAARDALIERLLRAGISVACDDTNLPQPVARDLAKLGARAGATVRVLDMTDVPLALCIARDFDREGGVGEDVIRGMHDRFLAGKTAPLPDPREETAEPGVQYTYAPNVALPPAWIVDVDGTLALMGERGPFDWHRVGEDTLNDGAAELVRSITRSGTARIVVMSGRDGSCWQATTDWLEAHDIAYDALYMRTAGDTRKDSVVKLELFRAYVEPRYAVVGVIDDRQQVVDMWRSIGLFCAQVASGDF